MACEMDDVRVSQRCDESRYSSFRTSQGRSACEELPNRYGFLPRILKIGQIRTNGPADRYGSEIACPATVGKCFKHSSAMYEAEGPDCAKRRTADARGGERHIEH